MSTSYWFVPHTHWDREWYLSFQDFRWKLVRSMDEIFATLRADPDFTHFMLDGQTIVLEDYLEIRPERRGELQELVRSGRIAVGPWYVQPDDILVTAEALVRNLERGIRMAADFGAVMRVGYVPDSFGHCAGLPCVLRGFGIDSASLMRGAGPTLDRSFFTWASRDGSQVLVAYLLDSYGNGADLLMEPAAFREGLAAVEERQRESLLPGIPLLVMNGMDHRSISTALPRVIAETGLAESARIGPLAGYIEEARGSLGAIPGWAGELRSSWRFPITVGCTSARSWFKREDQAVSALLERQAEPLAAMAAMLGSEYPSEAIDLAWKHLLQNQPHDSICGCSIDPVHEDMRFRYAQARGLGANIATSAAREIASRVDLPGPASDSSWVVAVNPGPSRKSAVLSFPASRLPADPVLVDRDGVRHPAQLVSGDAAGSRESAVFFDERFSPRQLKFAMGMVREGRIMELAVQDARTSWESPTVLRVDLELSTGAASRFDWAAWSRATVPLLGKPGLAQVHAVGMRSGAKTVIFSADLPSFGARGFRLEAGEVRGTGTSPAGSADQLRARRGVLENSRYRLRVLRDGSLEMADKATGRLLKGINAIIDDGDRGDEYNHDSPARDRVVRFPASVRTDVVESGPVRATLRIRSTWRLPTGLAPDRGSRERRTARVEIVRFVTLLPENGRIEFRTEIDNQARDHRMRVCFPLPEKPRDSLAGGTFGAVRRPVRPDPYPEERKRPSSPELGMEEQPMTHPFTGFVAASAESAGIAVFARGMREYEVEEAGPGPGRIMVTLFRSIGFLSRGDLSSRRGNAGPDEPTPGAQEIGRQTFEYALLPYPGPADEATLSREWEEYRVSPLVIERPAGRGELPDGGSLLEVLDEGLILSSFRRHASGAYSLRVYDAAGVARVTSLKLSLPFRWAKKTRLDGTPICPLAVDTSGPRPTVQLPVDPWEVITIELGR